ncbi:MAG: CDP-diacylglycerol--glycerol-3-phosphate 3-phosphatidyltransferase [Oscillospiraceae bacterium]|nr:CDP-diacylglycerol--glycerol-3-phosphate 3-phosphatidyltransferase [Oscillospiraceae bacterium]
MNLANKLTVMRVVLIPVFLLLLYLGFPGCSYFALAVFVIASLTDFLDGQIARRKNMVTTFGKFLDPLADKMLVFAALLWFCAAGRFPVWAMALVAAREFAVSGLRMIAASEGKVMAAAWSGKIKTASTMVCIILMFFPVPPLVDWICTLVIVLTTVYSGVEYFVKNRGVISFE